MYKIGYKNVIGLMGTSFTNSLDTFEKEIFNNDKKIIRSINGSLFPILTAYDLLIKS